MTRAALWRAARWLVRALGVTLTVLGLVDLPEHLETWRTLLMAWSPGLLAMLSAVSGNGGRWALVLLGLLLALFSYDVPQRWWARLRQPNRGRPDAATLRVLEIRPDKRNKPDWRWPFKLRLRLRNDSASAVVVSNLEWIDWDGFRLGGHTSTAFGLRTSETSKDVESVLVAPNGDFFVWIGVDSAIPEAQLHRRLVSQTLGTLRVTLQKGSDSHVETVPLRVVVPQP